MAWHDIDWLQVQVREYETSINDLVREVYLAAYKALEKAFVARKAWHKAAITSAQDAAGADLAALELMYTENRWDEQRQALTTMALSLLASANKSFLDQIKALFNTKRPPNAGGYAGNGHLRKQIVEYKGRFNVDLEKIDGFKTVRETELARHCSVHNERQPTADYLQQTECRLIGQDGKINADPEILDKFFIELVTFARALYGHMKVV